MLQGRRVIHDLGTKAAERAVQQGRIGHAAQNGFARHVWIGGVQAMLDSKKVALGRIQQDEPGRACRRDRFRQRRSNKAARARNENRPWRTLQRAAANFSSPARLTGHLTQLDAAATASRNIALPSIAEGIDSPQRGLSRRIGQTLSLIRVYRRPSAARYAFLTAQRQHQNDLAADERR